jgi:hypothetical protein
MAGTLAKPTTKKSYTLGSPNSFGSVDPAGL